MKSFQVLDRNQEIHQHTLLEASAGTGKTFSIENIVVRLLIDKEPIGLEQILIVTFTRAATRDLKVRIHNNIQQAIQTLKCSSGAREGKPNIPDYLLGVIEGGEENLLLAIRRLEQALFAFDLAQIYTIHKFCSKTLSENALSANFSFSRSEDEGLFSKQKMKMALRDYFRGGNLTKNFSRGQLDLLMDTFSGDTDSLENEIVAIVGRNIEIAPLPGLDGEVESFNIAMDKLRRDFGFSAGQIVDDFTKLAPNYNKVIGRDGKYKFNYLEKVKAFSNLFDKESWDVSDLDVLLETGLPISKALCDENKKKRGVKENPAVKIPEMARIFEEHLSEFVSVNRILARLSCGFQKALKKRKEKEESFSHDDFLLSMKRALENPEFKAAVRSRYKAAVIDEFQDTDPLQWEIFQELFLADGTNGCCLYIVGDPKQSIYSFRQADIYTYLEAAEKIPSSSRFSLDTNFRSQRALVEALNAIFCGKSCPGLFPLPKKGMPMEYPLVLPSKTVKEVNFCDGKGALHFCIAEDKDSSKYPLNKLEADYFLPFIAEEIRRLTGTGQFDFSSFCILVSDHYQARRASDFLKSLGIPVAMQKAAKLGDSPAVQAMKELLLAVQNPKDISLLKIALGGKLIRWTQEEVRGLEDPLILEGVFYKFFALRTELFDSGFHSFFNLLLKTCWKNDSISFLERFLIEEDSEEFLNEVMQVADFALEYENSHISSFSSLVQCLDQLLSNAESEEDQIKIIGDSSRNAVQMMTIFFSKGLEFDIVFPLGLLKRRPIKDTLFPAENGDQRILVPFENDHSEAFKAYCRELDAEKMRQLYVAMTRAKFRLYLPVIAAPKSSEMKFGAASPMDLFLARFGQEEISDHEVYHRLSEIDSERIAAFLGTLGQNISVTSSVYTGQSPPLQKIKVAEEANIVEPPRVRIPGHPMFLQSFTSLSSKQDRERISAHLAPHDFKEENKTPHTLPSGTETGTLLHNIFEAICFENFKTIETPSAIDGFIHPFVSGTEYEPWKDVLSEILFHTLKAKLFDKFCLGEISSKKCIREGEFLYKSFISEAPGFLKGFIDLFFEHEGKVYLVDWKSNWLGPGREFYSREHLHASMAQNDYFLQARLYSRAAEKYWGVFDKGHFNNIFGGVCYLFLRGINSTDNGSSGIYYVNPRDL